MPRKCPDCGVELPLEGLDPVRLAHDWHTESNRLVHTRLNYWFVTEGLLLTAFAAASEGSLGSESLQVRSAIAIGGIFFTMIWHSLLIRVWHWTEWYFRRSRHLHADVCEWGQPDSYDDSENLGAFPPDRHWMFYMGSGLGFKQGIHLITAAFYVVWSVMVWTTWKNMHDAEIIEWPGPDGVLWALGIAGVMVAVWTACVEIAARKK